MLDDLRKHIDDIDHKILKLLGERGKLVQEVGRKKQKHNISTYSPAREKQILDALTKENKGPLSALAVRTIFGEILSSCRALEKPLKISFLGPAATFTHMAVLQKFGSQIEGQPQSSITDVFRQVEKGEADYGVVPIENSTEGAISHTLDMFMNSELHVCAEVYLNVSHHLLSNSPLSSVKKVYSKQEAFAQCKRWLQNHLPSRVHLIETSSTSHAAQLAAKEKGAAAIASSLAASYYNLRVLAPNIHDMANNRTRFLVVGGKSADKSGEDKTSLMFSVKHTAGSLFKAIEPFHKNKINMTMIESRPTGQKLWEYVFFIDVEGHAGDAIIKKTLKEMQKHCLFLKVLGSYPEA